MCVLRRGIKIIGGRSMPHTPLLRVWGVQGPTRAREDCKTRCTIHEPTLEGVERCRDQTCARGIRERGRKPSALLEKV
jgi:hypothetical protein